MATEDRRRLHYVDGPGLLPSGTYIETVDVGKLVPSTKITVTISSRTLSGNPAFACKIEVSQDNAIWRTISDNATVVYATQFRYVRYTITATAA